MKNKIILFLSFLFTTVIASAQTTAPEMADTFRSEGKIYVVIAVLGIIFLCLIAYLIYLDVKIRRLEK